MIKSGGLSQWLQTGSGPALCNRRPCVRRVWPLCEVPHLHSRFHHRIWVNTVLQHYFAFHFHVCTVLITNLFELRQYSDWSGSHEMDLIWTGTKCWNLCLADVPCLINWNFPLHTAVCHTIHQMFVGNKTIHCWRCKIICHYMMIRQCTNTCTVGNTIHSNETASSISEYMMYGCKKCSSIIQEKKGFIHFIWIHYTFVNVK